MKFSKQILAVVLVYPLVMAGTFGLMLMQTACTSEQVATVEADLTKFAPVVLNALTLACVFTPASGLCSTGAALINADLAKLTPLLQTYQTNLAAGKATNADWNALNALFLTFEQDSAGILSLLRISSGGATAEAIAVGDSAELFLSALEAAFPSAPVASSASNISANIAARDIVTVRARPAVFAGKLPAGVSFVPNPSKAQLKQEGKWLREWQKSYNQKVAAAQKSVPSARLQKLGGGFWSDTLNSLGNAIGEAKFGQ
jgi:hypothetical protein